jgi:hypothetical protein
MGLLELFGRDVGRISCEPLQAVAIYRLCLAILWDSVGAPEDGEQWKRNIRGEIDLDQVRRYLLQRRALFDLGGDKPFLQCTFKGFKGAKPRSPWVLDFAQDNGSLLWCKHPLDDIEPMEPDLAARAILSYNAYTSSCGQSAKKGGESVYTSRGPLGNSVCCMLGGNTVVETLALNLYPSKPVSKDIPFWGDGNWGNPNVRRVPKGPREALVWPSRRIGLCWEKGRVANVQLQQGKALDQKYCDQMSYQVARMVGGKEELYLPEYGLEEVWRVIPSAFGSHGIAAAVAMRKWAKEVEPPQMMLSCTGMMQGQYSKIHAWGAREADFGANLFREEAFEKYCDAVRHADILAALLLELPWKELPDDQRKKGRERAIAVGKSLVESYWARLGEDGCRLANGQIEDNEWKRAVRAAGDAVLMEHESRRGLWGSAMVARADWRIAANG